MIRVSRIKMSTSSIALLLSNFLATPAYTYACSKDLLMLTPMKTPPTFVHVRLVCRHNISNADDPMKTTTMMILFPNCGNRLDSREHKLFAGIHLAHLSCGFVFQKLDKFVCLLKSFVLQGCPLLGV